MDTNRCPTGDIRRQPLLSQMRSRADTGHRSGRSASAEIAGGLCAGELYRIQYEEAKMNIQTIAKMIFFIAVLFVVSGHAAAPANDSFTNAQAISGNAGMASAVSTDATRESGEPIHALNRGGASVWYKYVAPGNGVLALSTISSDYNTLLAVYTGTTFSNLKVIAAIDDDAPDVGYGTVTIATQLNTTYYIAVDGHNNDGAGAESGTLKLSWKFTNVSLSDSFSTPHSLLSYPRGGRVGSNAGASKELGEPAHAGNPGGKSIWFLWRAPDGAPRSYTFSTKGSVRPTGTSQMFTLLAIYMGESVSTLTPVVSSSNFGAKVTFTTIPGMEYRIAVDGFDDGQGADTGTINLTWRPTNSTKDLDFDSDGRTDITQFRPTNGIWYTLDSVTGSMRTATWGTNGDRPVPGRFDSDDRLDYNVFRPDTGTWWTLGTQTGATQFHWGVNTDIPFNFRGGSSDYVGVFRPTDGRWYIYIGVGYNVQFGKNGDIPVPADYDGDGNDNIAIFRPSDGNWWFLNQLTGEQTPVQFGLNGDRPVPADYDGDGRADIAVYRPANGTWYVRRSSDGLVSINRWGVISDKPQPGDYDGDALADLAVYRPINGTWYILRSSDGSARFVTFGTFDDKPIAYFGVSQ